MNLGLLSPALWGQKQRPSLWPSRLLACLHLIASEEVPESFHEKDWFAL